jgi:hypothetical protein
MQNQHISAFNAIDDDIFSNGKASQARAYVRIAPAPNMGIAGEHAKAAGKDIDQPVGDLYTIASTAV